MVHYIVGCNQGSQPEVKVDEDIHGSWSGLHQESCTWMLSVGTLLVKWLSILFKISVIVDVIRHLHGSREQYKDAPMSSEATCHMSWSWHHMCCPHHAIVVTLSGPFICPDLCSLDRDQLVLSGARPIHNCGVGERVYWCVVALGTVAGVDLSCSVSLLRRSCR